jgi:hypothetical protein
MVSHGRLAAISRGILHTTPAFALSCATSRAGPAFKTNVVASLLLKNQVDASCGLENESGKPVQEAHFLKEFPAR